MNQELRFNEVPQHCVQSITEQTNYTGASLCINNATVMRVLVCVCVCVCVCVFKS